jgi:hypothetical protein
VAEAAGAVAALIADGALLSASLAGAAVDTTAGGAGGGFLLAYQALRAMPMLQRMTTIQALRSMRLEIEGAI